MLQLYLPLLLFIAAIVYVTVKLTDKKGSYQMLAPYQIAVIAFSLLLMLVQSFIPYQNVTFRGGALASSLLSTALSLLAIFLTYFRKNSWAYLSLAAACASGIVSVLLKIY
ncbi:hypothetical protein [Paenibacillus sp. Leaf72]|uniref:hypothetical protein n=1 Tax=Paenibacillus sp. Leaf72 TaxID=1736234 RepID=UPI0006F95758|nr:hypothetical protein [Paenibacillus sp. Leaf72]KQO16581.1 hypothetical protein ASF12_26475 [Paenibacillus sp. Leaf72]